VVPVLSSDAYVSLQLVQQRGASTSGVADGFDAGTIKYLLIPIILLIVIASLLSLYIMNKLLNRLE
jgi:hypothetical protein